MFFWLSKGTPHKVNISMFYHEISWGVCFLKKSCDMIQHVPSHVQCANSRRWKRMTRHQRGPQRILILSSGSWLCFYGGIFRKHSNGMNLICFIFILFCRCCRSNPCDTTQSVQQRNLHNSQVMVRSEARNGLRMMPRQHGARKTQHRSEGFWHFFWTQPFWTI